MSVDTTESSVCFVLDAVLEEGHPRFYWPLKAGEQYPYARLKWRLEGAVHWNEGPNLDHPAIGADGELDYGNIDTWLASGSREILEGEWGNVIIDEPVHTVVYLDG